MQIIILSGNAKRRMQMGSVAFTLLVVVIVLVVAAAYTAGFRLGITEAPLARNDSDFVHRAMLLHQQRDIDEAKTRARFHLDQLTFHLAAMKSRVEQLDALGARLVKLMGVDAAEYAFDTPLSQAPLSTDTRRTTAGAKAGTVSDFVAELDTLGVRLDAQAPKFESLEQVWLLEQVEREGSPSGRPVNKGWISSHFGWRTDPITGRKAFHDGVDFAGRYKSPIIAVASGVVTHSESRRGYGNIVQIKHPGGLSTRYAHNAKNTVSVGDKVERGEVIALMGSTGRSTGAHVHFEVIRGRKQINPLGFIGARN